MHERDRIAEPWGQRTPYGAGQPWPVRVDSHLEDGVDADGVDRWVQTASILHSNGDALDVAVADGRMVGVRGRAGDRVNHGRLGVKDLFGWQANASPDRLTRPLVRRDGRLVESDWDAAMGLVVARTRELLDEQGPSAIGFYTTGQLFAEEYYTLGLIAHGGLGTNHVGRQHAPVHGHRGGGPQGVVRVRRPARLVHGHRPRRRDRALRAQHGRDPERPVDARARPARRPGPAGGGLRGPARDAGRPRGHRPPRPPARHQRRADERAAARGHPRRPGRPRLRRRARGRLRRARRARRRVPARAGGRDLRRARRAHPRGGPRPRGRRAAAVDGPAGLLPVAPGDGGGGPGQQPQPDPRDARTARLRDPPDERAADRAEHPRVRRRRRPAGVSQLVQRRARRRPRPGLERRHDGDPALLAADPRHADDALRRAGVDPDDVGHRHEPGGVAPRARAHPRGALPGAAVPGGAGHLPVGDRPARRRGAARRHLGREDRHLHQRRPAPSTCPRRRSTRRDRRARTSTSCWTTPPAST